MVTSEIAFFMLDLLSVWYPSTGVENPVKYPIGSTFLQSCVKYCLCCRFISVSYIKYFLNLDRI